MSATTAEPSAYYKATQESDEKLQQRLREISGQYDAGAITSREAADARVSAMAAHLAACTEARGRYLDGAA